MGDIIFIILTKGVYTPQRLRNCCHQPVDVDISVITSSQNHLEWNSLKDQVLCKRNEKKINKYSLYAY